MDPDAISVASKNGHVNVVEWFHNNGYYHEEKNNTWDELVSGGMYDY